MPRVSTGLNEFDVELGGGIPPGSVVVIRAPPAAPVELLLGVLAMAQADRAKYLTTMRLPPRVRRTLEAVSGTGRTGDDASAVSVFDIRPPIESVSEILDVLGMDRLDDESDSALVGLSDREASEWQWDSESPSESNSSTPASATSSVSSPMGTQGGSRDDDVEYLGDSNGESTEPPDGLVTDRGTPSGTSSVRSSTETQDLAGASVASDGGSRPVWVVDSMSTLLESVEEWPQLLWRLEAAAAEEGGVVYLSLRMPDDRPPSAAESEVLDMASAVFEYEIERGSSLNHSLLVTRFLGGTPPERRIGLEVSDRIGVNPNRTV